MGEEKKKTWFITSTQTVGELVTFEKEVTSEEAIEIYGYGMQEDVLETQLLSIDSIGDAE